MGFLLVPKLVTLSILKWHNGCYFAILLISVALGPSYVTVVEVRSILSATEMQHKESTVFATNLIYGDILRGY